MKNTNILIVIFIVVITAGFVISCGGGGGGALAFGSDEPHNGGGVGGWGNPGDTTIPGGDDSKAVEIVISTGTSLKITSYNLNGVEYSTIEEMIQAAIAAGINTETDVEILVEGEAAPRSKPAKLVPTDKNEYTVKLPYKKPSSITVDSFGMSETYNIDPAADPYYYKSEPFDLSEYDSFPTITSSINVDGYEFDIKAIEIDSITYPATSLTTLAGSGDFDGDLTIEVKCKPYGVKETTMPAGGGSAAEIAISPEYKGEKIEYTAYPITGIVPLTAVSGSSYTNTLKLDLTGCGEVNFNVYSIDSSISEEMRELYLPSKCTIGVNTFPGSYFTALEKVVFSPNTELTIGASAFNGCAKLESINLENTNLAVIDDYAFSSCTSLTQVTIPQSVTAIGAAAFYNCSNLAIVYILPRSTAWAVGAPSIDQYAFYGCGSAVGSGELDVFFMDDPNAFSGFESSTYPSYAKGRWGTATYSWNPSTVQWE